jgi:hypothetical protein
MKGALAASRVLSAVGAPAGMRPLAPSQVVRESMDVFAAVAPALGRLAALVLASANTAMMTLFLEEVSQTFADFFIVMQVDQASWHHSKALVIPPNIRTWYQARDLCAKRAGMYPGRNLRQPSLCN